MKHWTFYNDNWKCDKRLSDKRFEGFVLEATCIKCLKHARRVCKKFNLRADIKIKLDELIKKLEYDKSFEKILVD